MVQRADGWPGSRAGAGAVGKQRCGSRQKRAQTVKTVPAALLLGGFLCRWMVFERRELPPHLSNSLFLASHSHDPRVNPLMLILKPLFAPGPTRTPGC